MSQENIEAITNKVLLIDDNDIDLLIIRKCMERESFAKSIISEPSALDALKYLKQIQNDEAEIPDFIFLDMEMPDVDGFKFLEEFHKLSLAILNRTKVLMISSSLDNFRISKAQEHRYVSDFIQKPVTTGKIKALKAFYLLM